MSSPELSDNSEHFNKNNDSNVLPPYMLDSWRLWHFDDTQKRTQLDDISLSSLSKSYLNLQLGIHDSAKSKQQSKRGVPSLTSSVIAGTLDALQTSPNPAQDAKTLADNLSLVAFKRLLMDPKLPYQAFRVLLSQSQQMSDIEGAIEKIDVDEFILQNERYVRSRGVANRDGKYLLELEQLPVLLSHSEAIVPDVVSIGGNLSFARADLPRGGLEVLDYYRNNSYRNMHIHGFATSFKKSFERITENVLHGLDWSHIFMAGGMALATLMHLNPEKDNCAEVVHPDIDLYIYGLTPEQANVKLEQIYNAWSRNLPSKYSERLVVKNAKTVNFLTKYPGRRVQVVLKLLPSPTDILLNFDLDACAIGFDGDRVLMLPRFVRALETGYSVFRMDLVWGHHLGDRRATQDSRVFKYADRGFGIRFLPSYARSLEQRFESSQERDRLMEGDPQGESNFEFVQRARHPYGPEPGLKTLKRIAYLGRDFVHRFCFGVTPLAISSEEFQASVYSDIYDQEEMREWREAYTAEEQNIREAEQKRGSRLPSPDSRKQLQYSDLSGRGVYRHLPDGRKGLGNFEIFMRNCEAWKLDAEGYIKLVEGSFASTEYDSDVYDDIPTYKWDPEFVPDQYAQQIDDANNLGWWGNTKAAICKKLFIEFTTSGFTDYATRRLRRQVHGPDLESVMNKQLTIPVNIPQDLEAFLTQDLPARYPDLPASFTSSPCLIPLHDPSTYSPAGQRIPSLHDTGGETGNLRYWVITNETMWAGQHRAIDEMFELLWALFQLLMWQSGTNLIDTTEVEAIYHIARTFRRRIVMPDVTEDQELGLGLPTEREALLFRPWALTSPVLHSNIYTSAEEENHHELFGGDGAHKYPFDDSLFWKGDEEELGTQQHGKKRGRTATTDLDDPQSEKRSRSRLSTSENQEGSSM